MRNKAARIKKITKTSVLITGFIITMYGYVLYALDYYKSELGGQMYFIILSLFIFITVLLLYYGREKIFDKILRALKKSPLSTLCHFNICTHLREECQILNSHSDVKPEK